MQQLLIDYQRLKVKPIKVYLASPYTHEQYLVRALRARAAARAAGVLLKAGYLVFSPIVHGHLIAMYSEFPVPIDYSYWESLNKEFIIWSDVLYILTLDGWKDSIGIEREIEIARTYNKEVYLWQGTLEQLAHLQPI